MKDLIPPICKHTFAPEVDPSELIDYEAEFQALNGIDWSSPTFQAAAEDKEVEKGDPEASGHQSQEDWSAGRFIDVTFWKIVNHFDSVSHVIG